MRGFDIDGRSRWFSFGVITENACRPLKELVLPLLDLIGMHVELLGQFHQRLSPLMAASATFALKAGLWFRRGRLVMVSPVPGI
jgi:hypothetical protein